ncbi:MAG TPA: phosphoglycolate phosphatase [Gammaproteobacteria bacterium]|nr:phosphoglycolate phosphatase [Gammaproteobacteria bacterium]
MRIEAVLFDMDGTLLDTAKDFFAIVQSMRAKRELTPLKSDADFRTHVSRGAQAMVAYAFSLAEDSPELEALREEFLSLYDTQHAKFTEPFPGILALLQRLDTAGIRWGVATNKPLRFAQPIMDALQLSTRSAVLLCPDHVANSKPAPDMLLLACEQLQLEPRQVLYVGDDKRDIDAGRAAKMRTVAVRYGYTLPGDNPANWGADAVIETIDELDGLLEAQRTC